MLQIKHPRNGPDVDVSRTRWEWLFADTEVPVSFRDLVSCQAHAAAVVERSGAKVVFVAEGDKVRMVPVQLGPDMGRGFELLQGPSPGTKLVMNPPETMADGLKFKERTQP